MIRSRVISAKIPETVFELTEDLVRLGLYPSKGEVVRTALWDLIRREHPRFANNPLIKER